MKVTLTHPEASLLEYAIDLYYDIYGKPPFEDIDDRYSIVMDASSQDFVKAAERLEKREAELERNDTLAELGFNDNPDDPSYLSQLVKAEFFAVSSLIQRWFIAHQYALQSKLRFGADAEKTEADYWARENPPRILITYASAEENADRILQVQYDALADIRALVHLLCHFFQNVSVEMVKKRHVDKRIQSAVSEERFTEQQIEEMADAATAQYNLFQGALSPLVDKLVSGYRMAKYMVAR